jgi:tetratricopeptide (TPR) repeat protein
MKLLIFILAFSSLLWNCNPNPRNGDEFLKDIRDNFTKEAKDFNEKTLDEVKLLDSLEKLANLDQVRGIRSVNNLIAHDSLYYSGTISELHFIKGNIYYRIDSFNKAIDEFSLAGGKDIEISPKYLAARAGAYVKINQFEKAFEDLTKAAALNHQFLWNIGNYYEIIGQKDSAISMYRQLYKKEENVYSYCKDRIGQLEGRSPKLLTELIYKHRERKYILLKGAN